MKSVGDYETSIFGFLTNLLSVKLSFGAGIAAARNTAPNIRNRIGIIIKIDYNNSD